MSSAVVVGSGPNGLTAAAFLARAGVEVTVLEAAEEIGGGTRTHEAIVPGLLHDQCSAVHPMGAGSPALRALGLERHGLRWCWPEVDCVHPLDGGRAGVLHSDIAMTAAGLGVDGRRWSALFARPAAGYDGLNDDILGPLLRVPRHPLRLARFGIPALLPATALARGAFVTEEARALFAGVAAHSFRPLERPLSSAIGAGIIVAGHAHGWPVAGGGSRAITRALAAVLGEHGGKIETGVTVTAWNELPRADLVLFDLA